MGRPIKIPDPNALLHSGAERVLHDAVSSRIAGTDGHDSVRRSLRSLCRVARSYGFHVEQVVVVCKDAWRMMPAARELAPDAAAQLLRRVIAQCIEEYYATDEADVAPLKLSDSASVPDSSLSFMLGPLS